MLPGSVSQVSEDEVNRIHCDLLLVFPATVCEGRISRDHTDWCLFEFAFKSYFIMKNANKHHLKTRCKGAIIWQ